MKLTTTNILHAELLQAAKQVNHSVQKKKYYPAIGEITLQLARDIINRTYTPSPYTCFAIIDPTPREILAPSFPDRIVHRWLVNKIEPFIDKRFLPCSYANRKGKGHHSAVKQLQYYLNNPANKYFLKLDVESFFNSIDHSLLLRLVNHWIEKLLCTAEEKKLLHFLSEKIITHNPTENCLFTGDRSKLKKIPPHKSYFNNPKARGLPLGNLSSQFFANIYLHELDFFVKHHLKAKYYIRYVDDVVLLAEDKEQLKQWRIIIAKFLKEELKLNLHPKKIMLQPVSYGIDFLGYIVRKDYLLVRKRVVKAFKQKLYFYNHIFNRAEFPYLSREIQQLSHRDKQLSGNGRAEKMYRSQQLNTPLQPEKKLLENMQCSINSYYGVFSMADTHRLRKTFYLKHFKGLQKYFYANNWFKKIGLMKKYAKIPAGARL
jgi:retron-type reverse transcriptase